MSDQHLTAIPPENNPSRRSFNGSERLALYLAAGGCCSHCGETLTPAYHADHVTPYAAGGPTDVINGQALCPKCNLTKGDRMVVSLRKWNANLRAWQQEAFAAYQTKAAQDFLLVATPGSGKTMAALAIARWLIETGQMSRIVIVVPSSHLRKQWAEAAHLVGIDLDPEWENQNGRETSEFHGVVVTYQAVSACPLIHRKNCSDRATLVIFDEIHHAAHDLGWGESLRTAFLPASRRLALSGTPFRSDTNRIPFVRYEENVSQADYSFNYEQALLQSGVIRDILFPHYEGDMEWLDYGETQTASFADELDAAGSSKRLRTAVIPNGEWLRNIICEANDKLLELRQAGHSNAAGLLLAMDQTHARRVADLMRSIANDPRLSPEARAQLADPVVVTSDDPTASDRISAFRQDSRAWAVAVRMISEGVDLPRLRVGVYASNIVTELFFRQVVGRFVRWISGLKEQTSYLYIPADSRLIEFAHKIQEERDHFIEEASEEEPSPDKPREPKQQDDEPSLGFFMPIDASDLVSQGIIHDNSVLPPGEIQEARALLADVATLVPEHLLVSLLRRVKFHFAKTSPTPTPVQPTPVIHEEARYRARDAARQVRNERAKSFAGLIHRVIQRPDCGYRDVIMLVNRKLKEHTGAYAEESTTAQLREQQKLLLEWAKSLAQAARSGQAAQWLTRWEEGSRE